MTVAHCAGGKVCVQAGSTYASCKCTTQFSWNPPKATSQLGKAPPTLSVTVSERPSGDVRLEVCKVGGSFQNDLHMAIRDTTKFNGMLLYNGMVKKPLFSSCTPSKKVADGGAWKYGEVLMPSVRVVSPFSCAAKWSDMCVSATKPDCGLCWLGYAGPLKRTCKGQ